MSMLNNKTPLSMIAAAALCSGSLRPAPPPLEETDAELAELIKWYEGQPQSIRRKLETVHVEKKVGRNDHCPCGSLKKFKRCCIDKA